MKERGKREIPERKKKRQPTASSGTIPTCENPDVCKVRAVVARGHLVSVHAGGPAPDAAAQRTAVLVPGSTPNDAAVERPLRRVIDGKTAQCFTHRGDERLDAHVPVVPSAPTLLGTRRAKFLQPGGHLKAIFHTCIRRRARLYRASVRAPVMALRRSIPRTLRPPKNDAIFQQDDWTIRRIVGPSCPELILCCKKGGNGVVCENPPQPMTSQLAIHHAWSTLPKGGDRVSFPEGSYRTVPLIGGFSRVSAVYSTLAFRHCSILTSSHTHRLSRPRCSPLQPRVRGLSQPGIKEARAGIAWPGALNNVALNRERTFYDPCRAAQIITNRKQQLLQVDASAGGFRNMPVLGGDRISFFDTLPHYRSKELVTIMLFTLLEKGQYSGNILLKLVEKGQYSANILLKLVEKGQYSANILLKLVEKGQYSANILLKLVEKGQYSANILLKLVEKGQYSANILLKLVEKGQYSANILLKLVEKGQIFPSPRGSLSRGRGKGEVVIVLFAVSGARQGCGRPTVKCDLMTVHSLKITVG
ncbi:hypothetical protein PR048_032197 [Dryococelus australis]|uniref:Uncharacterized protein n=1 Tax=Dryococelus australis TaxID=614101 RepID=A0ABQ9G5M6_9NEOP|nr:hypothetical protein PR048_032197 [Dryococelus australis]